MDVLAIIVTAVVGLVAGVVVAGAGYWFGGRAERQRRKNSLVDHRLETIHAAIAQMARARANITPAHADVIEGAPAGPEHPATRLRDELLAEGAGVIPDAIAAAKALEDMDLADSIRAAATLMGEAASAPREQSLGFLFGDRLNAVRRRYEALRDKLV